MVRYPQVNLFGAVTDGSKEGVMDFGCWFRLLEMGVESIADELMEPSLLVQRIRCTTEGGGIIFLKCDYRLPPADLIGLVIGERKIIAVENLY